MAVVHIVWDWNGTLLDDLDVVVDAVSKSVVRYGVEPLDANRYRDHFTRPVRAFYDSLFGRAVTDMEWEDLNKTFHDNYHAAVGDVGLARDAVASLQRVRALGWSQSLLSMSTHLHLVRLIENHGIAEFFSSVNGLKSPTGDLKVDYLRSHLVESPVAPADTVVIGDTPDDHMAAQALGVRSIAFDGGSHHRQVLDQIGVPVTASLLEAVELVESWFAS